MAELDLVDELLRGPYIIQEATVVAVFVHVDHRHYKLRLLQTSWCKQPN